MLSEEETFVSEADLAEQKYDQFIGKHLNECPVCREDKECEELHTLFEDWDILWALTK